MPGKLPKGGNGRGRKRPWQGHVPTPSRRPAAGSGQMEMTTSQKLFIYNNLD
jgi:hypothetical protein